MNETENLFAVLRQSADPDTVEALNQLAVLEVFAGSPDADRLSTEALTLGQALGLGYSQLSELFLTRGLYHSSAERRPQAVSYLRESARLGAEAGDVLAVGRAMGNLSDVLAGMDPAAAVDAARTSAEHLRRTGSGVYLAVTITNLAEGLLQLGDWDAAEAELTQAPDPDAHADIDQIRWKQAWLAALRGDARTAEAWLVEMPERRQASEDPQWKSGVSIVAALTAAARGRPQDALRHARAALAHTDALGISFETVRWAWPLAARCAYELDDTAATVELLAMLDSYQPGQLAPMLRAERDLVRALLAAAGGDGDAAASFIAAVKSLREMSTPYHLAHGLLDYAQYLTAAGAARDAGAAHDAGAAALAASAAAEARDIAGRLRCQPLLDRADALTPRDPVTVTPQDSPRVAR